MNTEISEPCGLQCPSGGVVPDLSRMNHRYLYNIVTRITWVTNLTYAKN
jgi:hypothetical protein